MKGMCTVTDDSIGIKGLYTNGENFYQGLTNTNFDMWLLRDTEELIVHAYYKAGDLLVTGLTIYQTNIMNRMILFLIICICLFSNLIYLYILYDKKIGIQK